MKVILTGGGTGGHIYPAVAIADKLKCKYEDAEILFVGTEKGLESEIVPQSGYPIKFITVSGFDRRNLLNNVETVKNIFKGSKEAKEILKEFKPDFVVGTGGYVCGPLVRMASKMGIPCFIHEQNACAGMTNKLLEKYVKKVFLGFEEASKHFKKKSKLVFTGNPVREAFFGLDREKCKENLGIDKDVFTVLCFGGSRGATKINELILELSEHLSGLADVKFFFVTGKVHYEDICEKAENLGILDKDNIEFKEYIDDMPLYLGASDLVICRSGALTVAELMLCGRASLLIPSPNVTADHQYHNAKAVSDAKAAEMIVEKDLNSEKAMAVISELRNNEEKRKQMEETAKKIGKIGALDEIVNTILEIVGEEK